MSFSNATENAILALLLNATAWANIADNAASSPLTQLYLSGHTAAPGDAGAQNTTELAYTSYARVAIPRTTSGFAAPSSGSSALASLTSFPAGTGGSGTMTHFGIGSASSGTGVLYGDGTVTPNIVTGNGVTPQLTTATTVSLD